MPRRVFIDTGYWLAALDTRDQHREKFNAVKNQIDKAYLVTTPYVLAELLNALSKQKHMRVDVANFVLQVCKGAANTEVIEVSPEQYQRALSKYKSLPWTKWGQVDCISYIVIEDENIKEAISFDEDFAQFDNCKVLDGNAG